MPFDDGMSIEKKGDSLPGAGGLNEFMACKSFGRGHETSKLFEIPALIRAIRHQDLVPLCGSRIQVVRQKLPGGIEMIQMQQLSR